jgi:alkanesulfonate monooxygenase SsuD/methylene tetrahydromethanopterin reductase-like flavin-dependent oxidoreductase (luciferase family)
LYVQRMELGVYTFGDVLRDPGTGTTISAEQRLKNLVEEIELADQVGLDVFGLGEHHRPDYAVSAPSVVLGAAAVRTSRIRLTSAVTVLSSEDPVRVFQQYATVDLLSGGRAEVMAGRGSFIESFPLFGLDLDDYDELFAEKLDLLLRLRESVCRSRWRSSVASRRASPRWRRCTAARRTSTGTARCRCRSTGTASSPRPPRRPRTASSRPTPR